MDKKQCCACKVSFPKTQEYFSIRNDRKSLQFQSSCKECHKKYRRDHYNKNRKLYIGKAALYRHSMVSWFNEIKSKLKCLNCGDDRWWILDFHHRDPSKKEGNISYIMRNGSKKSILKEIKKCDTLCPNCHRDLHYKQKSGVTGDVPSRPS